MAAKRPEDLLLAFFTCGLDNPFVCNATEAAQAVAEEAGVPMDVFSGEWDPARQLTQIEDAVSSGDYDALVFEAIDGDVVL